METLKFIFEGLKQPAKFQIYDQYSNTLLVIDAINLFIVIEGIGRIFIACVLLTYLWYIIRGQLEKIETWIKSRSKS